MGGEFDPAQPLAPPISPAAASRNPDGVLVTLIGENIFALSNPNHLSINELNYLIDSLAINLN